MSQAVEKVPLFEGWKEWSRFLGIAALLLALHLGWLYREYRQFVTRPFYYTWGEVLEAKAHRNGRGEYRTLKVRTEDGLTLWTRSYRSAPAAGRRIRLQLLPTEKIGFREYLKGPYVPSRIKRVVPPPETLKNRLRRWIDSQHTDPRAAAFYRSIFLADPLPSALRQKIAALGSSHLVALSGFHLGILWGVLFLLLKPLYRFVQRRFFPWRYDLLDLGSFSLALLAGYLWLTGVPPSLLRAYAMLLFGWAAVLLGVEIVSFGFLSVVGVSLLVFVPTLIFSWGFWLSMSGVFAIFLLLKYWGHLPPRAVALFVIPFGIYLLMFPVSHTLFDGANLRQNLSPVLSLLFVPFYPLAMLLHLLGIGGVLDSGLSRLWSFADVGSFGKVLPLWILPVYGAAALAATRYKMFFYALFGAAFISLFWIFSGSG